MSNYKTSVRDIKDIILLITVSSAVSRMKERSKDTFCDFKNENKIKCLHSDEKWRLIKIWITLQIYWTRRRVAKENHFVSLYEWKQFKRYMYFFLRTITNVDVCNLENRSWTRPTTVFNFNLFSNNRENKNRSISTKRFEHKPVPGSLRIRQILM